MNRCLAQLGSVLVAGVADASTVVPTPVAAVLPEADDPVRTSHAVEKVITTTICLGLPRIS